MTWILPLKTLRNLDKLYETADNKGKREIIGLKYPEKLVFDKKNYWTFLLNEAVELLIYQKGRRFQLKIKMGKPNQIFDLLTFVLGLDSNQWPLSTYAEKIGIINRDALSSWAYQGFNVLPTFLLFNKRFSSSGVQQFSKNFRIN